jgi:hypothetical protein
LADHRKLWCCPDLGTPKRIGYYQPIPGSDEQFPDCPKYYLRQLGDDLPAVHLIDDATHPAMLASMAATEIESGARTAESLSPKLLEAARVWMHESAGRRAYEREQERNARR